MTPITRAIEIEGEIITVRELTVDEILTWMAEKPESQQETVMESLLLQEISLTDLTRMTDLTQERIGAFTPSQLRQVVEVCKELNSDFFRAIDKVVAMTVQTT